MDRVAPLGYTVGMPKRSRKKPGPKDLNELAARIVRKATGEEPEEPPAVDKSKDPAAVELGRRGGKKGGRARAERMTPAERSEAARKAAEARWSGPQD
jgi:hypothetical protein